MTDIFVSHAAVDRPLAQLLVDFLKDAIGVPGSAIFCSSVDGHGIPLGVDFNVYMRKQIRKPKLVIMVMTPSYMESEFCLMELGAAWAISPRSLPIVVPPVTFDRVSRTLGLVQGWSIEDHARLVDIRTIVRNAGVALEARDDHAWDRKRSLWRADLRKVLKKLPGARSVAAEDHRRALDEIEGQKGEIEALEGRIDEADAIIEQLRNTKDRAEVAAVLRGSKGGLADDRFTELLSEVRLALPECTPVVTRHLIMDHHSLAGNVDWRGDGDAFVSAVQRKLLDKEGNVLWDGRKLAPLGKALVALDRFMASEEGEALASSRDDEPMEPDDLEFWQHHLHV